VEHPDSNIFDNWNRIGLRGAYGQMLLHLAESGNPVFAVSADLGRSSGLDRFVSRFPERYLGVGIAEQNMVGVAAGIAESGESVFVSSFAPFLSLRAGDQVRMNLGYMQMPVALVGLGSGLSLGFLGSSHYGLEDLSVISSFPGIEICSPTDAIDLYNVLLNASNNPRPLYIRLTGASNIPNLPSRPNAGHFSREATWLLNPHAEIVVIAAGITVHSCFSAIATDPRLADTVGLLQMNWLRPLDMHTLFDQNPQLSRILVFEEHSVRGGLGTAVLTALSQGGGPSPAVEIFGIPEVFPHGYSYQFGLSKIGLDEAGIKKSILDVVRVRRDKTQTSPAT